MNRPRQRHKAGDGAVVGDIVMGIDSDDTRNGERCRRVERADFGMAIRRAQRDAIQHPVTLEIVGEIALAGQQPDILDTLDRLTGTEFHRFISLRQAASPAR